VAQALDIEHDEAVRISAKTDYGIRVLLELASDTSVPMNCEAIASAQEIPYRFLKAIVQDLRRAGLVVSQRGCEGGYWLGRDAVSITIADVVRAVDGEVLMVRGEALTDVGYAGTAEHLGALWNELSRHVDELFATTIEQLLTGEIRTAELAAAR
jgi:Rrf2 family protein